MNTLHNVFDLLETTGTQSAFAVSLPSALLSINGEHFTAYFKKWCSSAAPLIHASVEVESLVLPELAYGSLIGKVSFPRQSFLIKNCPGEIVERWVSEIEASTTLNPSGDEVILCDISLEIGIEESEAQFDAIVEIDISEHPRLPLTT